MRDGCARETPKSFSLQPAAHAATPADGSGRAAMPRCCHSGPPIALTPRHLLAPVREEILQCLLERNFYLPPYGFPNLRRVTLQHHDVGWPEPGRVGLDGDALARGVRQVEIEDVADRPGAARAETVDVTRLTSFQQEPIPSNDIAYVGEITPGSEIADRDYRVTQARLDFGNLLREV